jgi:hypothetical protein
MRRSVRGIAFVVAALAHVALIALLITSARQPRSERADAPRMVLVFIEPEAPRVPNEPLRSPAPSLRLQAPNVTLPPPQVEPGNTITAPPEPSPEDAPPSPSVDWNQESRTAAARMAESLETERRRKGKFAPDPRFARPTPRPEFGWDRSKTHQIEALPEGGTIIHLNDRCALVLSGLLIPVCKLGKIPARGDLFEHMGDAHADNDAP